MARLGDVLTLVHSSRGRFRTARVAGRTAGQAWRLWWAGDDRFRFESDREGGGHVAVRAGPVWWIAEANGEAQTNDGDPDFRLGMAPEFGLLHTRSLLASAVLEVLGEERVAGRDAVVLRATPRPGAGHWRWWGFWRSTKPIEVPIDAERGVALGGLGFQVEQVAFDEAFPPGTFSQPYPTHLPRVRRGPNQPPPRELPLEEARRAVGFPVLLPGALPAGARFARCLLDSKEPPEWVGVSWAIDPGYQAALHLRQGPAVAREAAGVRAREIVGAGTRLLVEETGADPPLVRRVLAQHGGRWIEVDGTNLTLDAIVAVAVSVGEGEA